MKQMIKKTIPKPLFKQLKKQNLKIKLSKLYATDKNRYIYSYGWDFMNLDQSQLEARMMFDAHALEKGFSHLDFRPHFGLNALNSMSKLLTIFNENNFSKDSLRYQICLSAIKNYIDIHHNKELETTFLNNIFSSDILEEVQSGTINYSGVYDVKKADKASNSKANFEKLSQNRVSVREYSNVPVDIKDIKEAIQLSLKSPSVCNRQPARVHLLTNQEKMKEILKIQGGFNGFKLPPILLLITSDNKVFINENERNEAFIDGGLFSMSLLYSLEYKGLAACPLNAMFDLERENKIRGLMDIPEEESLIMFISVGHFLEVSKSPKSYRDGIDECLTIIE